MGIAGRRLLWLPAVVAALLTAWAALSRPAAIRLSDLGVYAGAVDGLRHGASLYDFISAGNAPFTYPPFAGLVFLPLAGAPALPLRIGWTIATLTTVFLLAGLLARRIRPGFTVLAPVAAVVLMVSAPVSSTVKYGQVSLFLAAMITVDVLLLRHHRAHGVLIGLAAAIKLTPLIFIPMLWFAGRRRAALVATATFAGCGAFAALVLPGDSWRFWTSEVSHVSRLGYITGVGNQSLNGALMRFDVATPARSMIALVAGGAIAAVALWHAARLARRDDWVSALVITGAAGIVLSPVSWTHHQFWLVLAAALPVRGRARLLWPVLVLAVMLLPVTALGPPLWSNLRLVLAITVAVVIPFLLTTRAPRHEPAYLTQTCCFAGHVKQDGDPVRLRSDRQVGPPAHRRGPGNPAH
ncbi:glycosyltransferase 87 family protein [Actinoplanes sp. NPDC051494]|uniref:glycosyltransferase 87 family protein n=1 Tax=Actinoplanes sp. NPDC051494 TaxID=3363907 RepID=UPI003792912E